MRRRDRERLNALRRAAIAKRLHVAWNRVQDERDPEYGLVAVSRGRYGPLLHPPGIHTKYALTLRQAEKLIETTEPE